MSTSCPHTYRRDGTEAKYFGSPQISNYVRKEGEVSALWHLLHSLTLPRRSWPSLPLERERLSSSPRLSGFRRSRFGTRRCPSPSRGGSLGREHSVAALGPHRQPGRPLRQRFLFSGIQGPRLRRAPRRDLLVLRLLGSFFPLGIFPILWSHGLIVP